MRNAVDYNQLADKDLDIIYGQHVARMICDHKAMVNLPVECSLYGKTVHWAPDEWSRPQPIGAGGDDFQNAIDAATALFGGLSIETVLLGASKNVITVYRAGRPDDKETGADPQRSCSESWDHATERDRWVSLRRGVIKCILALADAPLEWTMKGSAE